LYRRVGATPGAHGVPIRGSLASPHAPPKSGAAPPALPRKPQKTCADARPEPPPISPSVKAAAPLGCLAAHMLAGGDGAAASTTAEGGYGGAAGGAASAHVTRTPWPPGLGHPQSALITPLMHAAADASPPSHAVHPPLAATDPTR
jgi:hypothetical protein